MQRVRAQTSHFSLNVPIIQRAVCDVCGREELCVYIRELDRWMCEMCAKTVAELMEVYAYD